MTLRALSIIHSASKTTVKELQDGIMDTLAFATRYGRIGLGEAARLDRVTLIRYCQAVGRRIDKDNAAAKVTDA